MATKFLLTALAFVSLGLSQTNQQPLRPISTALTHIPPLGFGTWNLKDSPENTTSAVSSAIETGYIHIDCAAAYGNEKAVGAGIAQGLQKAKLDREDIWVTSKLWNDHHDNSTTVESALNRTLSDLGLTYLDLYLMHWPVGKSASDSAYHYDFVRAWHGMEPLLASGRVRHIGVSNFAPAQLDSLIKKSRTKPAVHQMELHPYLSQVDWIQHHRELGIAVTAYSPLGNMNPIYGGREVDADNSPKKPLLLENGVIKNIAEKRNCTPAQVVLSWGIRRGYSVIPKSKHEKYIKENFGATACHLNEKDLQTIGKLGEEPQRFNNPSKDWGVHLFKGLTDT